MGIEENKEVVRRFIEAREKYDIPTIDVVAVIRLLSYLIVMTVPTSLIVIATMRLSQTTLFSCIAGNKEIRGWLMVQRDG